MRLFVYNLFIIILNFGALNGLRNGIEVQQRDARFIGSIRLRTLEQDSLGSGYLCTAALISSLHAVTAATCVTEFLSSQLQIVLGVVDISTRNSRAVIRNIRRMHFHPTFNRTSELNEFYGNVAIVEFSNSIRQSTSRWTIFEYSRYRNVHVQPIQISNFILKESSICQFFSWSMETDIVKRNPYLLSTHLSIVGSDQCYEFDTVFCAHYGNISDPVLCENLGGPLVYDGYLYGIAARNTCDEIGHFVLISFYRNWIVAISASNITKIQNVYRILVGLVVLLSITRK